MIPKTLLTATIALSVVLSPSFARADNDAIPVPGNSTDRPDGCVGLIRECLSYGGSQRDECFAKSSTHDFCSNGALHEIVEKRSQLSPLLPPGVDAPGLLGPQLVDQECLNNFDNQLSGELLKGDLTPVTLRGLEVALDACRVDDKDNFLRP